MYRFTITAAILAFSAAALVLNAQSGSGGEKIAVCAKLIVTGTGADLENSALLIENGRIKDIVKIDAIPAGYVKVMRTEKTIAPGLIDAASRAGVKNDLEETAEPVDQYARAADALNLRHRDFALLAEAGITSVVIIPGQKNPVGGTAAVVKTGGSRERVVVADGPMAMSISTLAVAPQRFPTSFMALKKTIDDALTNAKTPEAATTPLGVFVRSKKPALVWAQSERDLLTVAEMKKTHGVDFNVIGAWDIREVLPLFEKSGTRVAMPCVTFESQKRELLTAKVLEDAGMVPAFYAEFPQRSADALRVSAAIAAKNGLSLKAALAAVTLVPAEMGHADARVGSLAAGKDADFIVLDGHPLDLSARLLETWISGERVASKKHMSESVR